MDRTKVSGTFDVGSIPAGAISQNPPARRVLWYYGDELHFVDFFAFLPKSSINIVEYELHVLNVSSLLYLARHGASSRA